MFLVAIFFVSGADAGSVVMGMLSERGTIEPTALVVLWGVLAGASAAVLLVMGGLRGCRPPRSSPRRHFYW